MQFRFLKQPALNPCVLGSTRYASTTKTGKLKGKGKPAEWPRNTAPLKTKSFPPVQVHKAAIEPGNGVRERVVYTIDDKTTLPNARMLYGVAFMLLATVSMIPYRRR